MTVNTVIAGPSTCTAPYAPTQQPFHSTAFLNNISGATASRADNARWGDWVNVRDFGATGNGSTDDTTAVQLAFNSIPTTPSGGGLSGGPWGTVYFPAGAYKVTSAISFQQQAGVRGIVIRGDGVGSVLFGTLAGSHGSDAGYVLKSNPGNSNSGPYIIRDMSIINQSTNVHSGAILAIGISNGSIENCNIGGFFGINAWGQDVVAVPYPNYSIVAKNCHFTPVIPNNPPATPGCIGFQMGNGHSCIGCDFSNWDTAIQHTNVGCVILGSFFNVNNNDVVLGLDDTGATTGSSSVLIAGNSMEGALNSIKCVAVGDLIIHGGGITGENGPTGISTIGIDLSGASSATIISCSPGGVFSSAAIKVPNSVPSLTFIGCGPNASGGGVPWLGGAGSTYIGCNEGAAINTVAFANLPASPYIGQTMIVNNCSTTTPGAAANGSGANSVWVLWTGTTWRVQTAV